jgi:hypothetical protein
VSSPEEFFRRVPRAVDALGPHRTSGPAYWREAWARRHTVAAVVLAVALFALNAAVGGWPTDALTLALLAPLSAAGGVVAASYLPSRGGRASTSTCAAGPLLITLAATILIGREPATPGTAGLAALLMVPALLLRAFGPTSC